ncbi:AraC-type DNA-binding protein [Pseudomonas pohangensis]|uniref:AraC-type DNA-binding protein n=1 Tax=Pseudomonas pohangensis TaxID=364197 RepID=A0A1H2F9W7_9PSED|nr:AraC family transcriptional regulator [Pseudomonas pohangensis]SDU04139.1 AraC-type DNA-binding protein [Pseudomonas pohangensis]
MVRSQTLIRAAALSGFSELADSFGLAPEVLLGEAGIDPGWLADPDYRIPVRSVCQLLERSALLAAAPDFGLRLSEHTNLQRLGWLGFLTHGKATVGEAFLATTRYQHLHNEASNIWLDNTAGGALIRVEFFTAAQMSMRQMTEMTIGVILLNFRDQIDPRWAPRLVCFRHVVPGLTERYQQLLGARVQFGADYDGILFDAADFARPNVLARKSDGEFVRQMQEAGTLPNEQNIVDLTQQLICTLLPNETCTSSVVADALSISRRTLHRQLLQHKVNFSSLLEGVRRELATRHIAQANRPLGEVASLLGFRSQSDFSNWFRHHFSVSPSAWRKQARASASIA